MEYTKYAKEQKISIVVEQMKDSLVIEDVVRKYNISANTFFYWKRTLFTKTPDDAYEQRMALKFIHPRTIISGLNKQYFLRDCLIRDFQHGKMLRHIVDVYYSIMSNRPDMEGKEMDEIKKLINDKIKL